MRQNRLSDEVRERVTTTAQMLFVERGYEQTTIREISAASGVSTGSIYHFFLSKEDIFLDVVRHGFKLTQQSAEQRSPFDDPLLALSLKWAEIVRLVTADIRFAELFAVAYRSWRISEVIIQTACQQHQALLADQLPNWQENDFLAATLIVKGSLASIVDERIHLDRLTLAQRISAVLVASLTVFHTEPAVVSQTIAQVLSIMQIDA